MKIGAQLTDADRVLTRILEDFVPFEIYDIHAHVWNAVHSMGTCKKWLSGYPLLGCKEHRAAIKRIVPGRKVHGLWFGFPEPKADRAVTNAWVADEVRCNATPLSRALALVSPQDDPAATRALLKHEGFVGIKVYHLYAARKDTFNASLDEYAPEWMWEVCHEICGVLMLHIVRDSAIADESNLAAVRRLCRKYPKCRLVLAHVARSFNYRNGTKALRHLADVDNAVLDMSAVTEADAMREAFRVLGPRRVMYGSDYPVSEMRGRCVTTGDSFFWIHPEIIPTEHVPAANFRMTTIGIESLLCLREACEECGLNGEDVKDLFLGNALRLLASHLPAVSVPRASSVACVLRKAPDVSGKRHGKSSVGCLMKPLVQSPSIRLAMLGMVDGNGHPYSWSAIFNGYDPDAMAKCPYAGIPAYLDKEPKETLQIPGARVTHVWTDDPADAPRVAKASLIPHVVKRAEDVIGQVDAVIIATDKGHEHVKRCRPFVEAGIPVFVDKPLVDNEADLKTFEDWVTGGAPIMSSSCMRYCKEFMPYRLSTHDLGAIRFASITTPKTWERYGIHALEAVYPILGPGFISVRNTGTPERNIVHLKHRCGADVVVVATGDMYGALGLLQLAGTIGHVNAAFADSFYAFKSQLEAFIQYLRSGIRPFPFEETVELMRLVIGGIRSREKGGHEISLTTP